MSHLRGICGPQPLRATAMCKRIGTDPHTRHRFNNSPADRIGNGALRRRSPRMTRLRSTASASAALVSGALIGWNGYGIPETRSVRPTA